MLEGIMEVKGGYEIGCDTRKLHTYQPFASIGMVVTLSSLKGQGQLEGLSPLVCEW